MKKIAFLVIMIAIPAVIFAAPLDICIGTNFNTTQTRPEFNKSIDFNQLFLGPEIRAKVLFLEFNTKANIYKDLGTGNALFVGTAGVSLAIDVGPIRIGAGIQTEEIGSGYMSGNWIEPVFIDSPTSDLLEGFLKSKVNWRFNTDLHLGHLVFGFDYTIPTEYIYGEKNQDSELLNPIDWANGRYSISILYSLF